MKRLISLLLLSVVLPAGAQPLVEPHHRLELVDAERQPIVALTLDACDGAFDADLIALLVAKRVPATIFATRKWILRNQAGVAALLAHPDLFDIEDHGSAHVPATVGAGRRVYGIAGAGSVTNLKSEVSLGADAIARVSGRPPRYFRGATAMYDQEGMSTIQAMGYTIAGFSVNADAGASLSQAGVVARLRGVRPGDIVIAHMNKPGSSTAKAFSVALPELLDRGFRFMKLTDGRLKPI